jgi:hypothetical protein
VLQIHPKSDSEAGSNATLGKFAEGYTGLTITNNTIKYPSSSAVEYKDGEKCAAGTPDAGKVGTVQARWWILSTPSGGNNESKPVGGLTTKSPADLKFQNRQVITVGFIPADQQLPQSPSTNLALTQTLAGAGPVATTTTSTPGATTTTAPAVTTTTAAPAATTTTKPTGTTSTTK